MVLINLELFGVIMKRLPKCHVVKFGSIIASYIEDNFRSLWECGRIKIMNIINFETIGKIRYIKVVG